MALRAGDENRGSESLPTNGIRDAPPSRFHACHRLRGYQPHGMRWGRRRRSCCCPTTSGYDANIVWEGLGFVPFALAVHFKSNHPESESVDREIAFYEATGIPDRTLRDGEALIIHDHREKIVGSREDR